MNECCEHPDKCGADDPDRWQDGCVWPMPDEQGSIQKQMLDEYFRLSRPRDPVWGRCVVAVLTVIGVVLWVVSLL
jgi:hypothetical protein